ncbi:MAG: hypothetical protein IPK97_04535 [Ahniella sp.]|nr:hypothetical protein [Ahniella sp.]
MNGASEYQTHRAGLESRFASDRDAFVADEKEHLQEERRQMGEPVVDRMQDMNNDGMHMVMQVHQQFSATEMLPRLAGDRIREALDVQSDFGEDLRSYQQEAERHHIYGEEALAYAAAKYTVEHPLSEHTPVAGSYLRGYLDTAIADEKIDGQRAAVLFAKLVTAGELQQADYAELSVISGGMHAK